MNDEITQALEKIFAADSDLYRGRGFAEYLEGVAQRPTGKRTPAIP